MPTASESPPTRTPIDCLVGATLAEQTDKSVEGRRCPGLNAFAISFADRWPAAETY